MCLALVVAVATVVLSRDDGVEARAPAAAAAMVPEAAKVAEVAEVAAEGAVRVRYLDGDVTELIAAAAVATRIYAVDDALVGSSSGESRQTAVAAPSICPICLGEEGEVAMPCCSALVCGGCARQMAHNRLLENRRCPFCRRRLSAHLLKSALPLPVAPGVPRRTQSQANS